MLSPISAYLVDLMHSRSAEVLAGHLSVDFFFLYGNPLLT